MAFTCSGASHYIVHNNITYHGVSARLKMNTAFGDRLGGLGTIRQSSIELHG